MKLQSDVTCIISFIMTYSNRYNRFIGTLWTYYVRNNFIIGFIVLFGFMSGVNRRDLMIHLESMCEYVIRSGDNAVYFFIVGIVLWLYE